MTPPFRAAVLVNSPGTAPIDTAFKHAFSNRITTASPEARVDFFDPIEAQTYPSAGEYDLIVLTGGGGTWNADARDVPWIDELQGFVRRMAASRQKVASICWGHQVTHVAMGGSVGAMDDGAFEVGVHALALTQRGSAFFSPRTSIPPSPASAQIDALTIHQFHERCVKNLGNGFVALAEGNQCFVNSANTILTFQGHPEMDAELSKQLLEGSARYACGADEARKEMEERISLAHDGVFIWERIVAWARE
ncbi:hypothetical protein E8E12_008755 [Didymella heteroderae]|uniref:Glutamine amidotransferase domain-containing protein n=1 Tax=Didymella heteroderae TaxID=1769908 RepID=A0A9P4WXQ2_9PLEO|nr:hypothetical protein E8E12_008755 [Didymella heteroderae]